MTKTTYVFRNGEVVVKPQPRAVEFIWPLAAPAFHGDFLRYVEDVDYRIARAFLNGGPRGERS